jgi:hypothetical protein
LCCEIIVEGGLHFIVAVDTDLDSQQRGRRR